jgi:hypothetical protein
MSVGTLLLILTAMAAVGGVTGVWLLILAWIDRPQHVWGMSFSRDLLEDVRKADSIVTRQKTVDDRHKLTVGVSLIGARMAYDVKFRAHGCSVTGSTRFRGRAHMMPGAEPIQMDVWMPEATGQRALLEVLWLQHRPHRHLGQRIDLRTTDMDDWRWYWRSLRFRGRRLVRTEGRWVERGQRDCPTIPDTKGAPAK